MVKGIEKNKTERERERWTEFVNKGKPLLSLFFSSFFTTETLCCYPPICRRRKTETSLELKSLLQEPTFVFILLF